MSRWVAIASVLLPLVVGASFAALVRRPGEAPPDDDVIDARVDVVMLGNSMSKRGIDDAVIERQLGVRARRIQRPDAAAPTWYAVLKRNADRGYLPPIVVLVGHEPALLATTPHSAVALERLLHQVDPDDPVFRSRTYGDSRTVAAVRTLQGRSGTLVRELEDSVRFGVAALLTDGTGPWRERGREAWERASLEVVGLGVETGPVELAVLGTPEGSYLGPIIEVARQVGSQVVVAHLPARAGGEADPELARFVVERGGTWVDLADAGLVPGDYVDNLHAGPRGRRKITRHLVDLLATLHR